MPEPVRCACRTPDVQHEGRRLYCGACKESLEPFRTAVWLDTRFRALQAKHRALSAQFGALRSAQSQAEAEAEMLQRLDASRARWRSRASGGPWHMRSESREPRWVTSVCGQRMHMGSVDFRPDGPQGRCPACDAWRVWGSKKGGPPEAA